MQKSVIIIGIIVLVTISAFAVFGGQSQKNVEPQNSNLSWHTDLNSTLAEAKQTNKPVFMDFYANWCSYCQKLDENTFSDPQVQDKLKSKYVLAKINIDSNPDIASKYKVYGVPTMVFLNPDGTEIKRNEGYLGPNELLNQL
ncbi:MAG: thioredoxin family protein [Methanobacterium sp.]